MSKLLKDLATVVRCKPLATGPNGIEVSVVSDQNFSVTGLSKVRATSAKQVNAQKICAGDVLVLADRSIMVVDAGQHVGKVVDARGVVLIRFASDSDTKTYVEFLRYAIRESAGDKPLYDWRETFNAIGNGQIEMPDLSMHGAAEAVKAAISARFKATEADKSVIVLREQERAAWEELLKQ